MHGPAALVIGLWATQLTFAAPAPCQADERPPYLKQLEAYGLSPTKESLGGYLESLHPSAEQQAQIQQLVRQLGAPDYDQREGAMRALVRRPAGITAVLEDAVAGDDAEIRWRARQILERTERESRALLHAVLTTIQREKIAGLATTVLGASPFCEEGYLQVALRRALAATATQADVPLLRRALKSPVPASRIAALQTLDVLLQDDAAPDALALLRDESEIVQCAAARVLAGHGRREALRALVELLQSSDMPVRLEAYRTLRSLTGQQFGYTVYDQREKRAAAIAQWTKWLETSGTSAPLHLPLRDLPPDLGRLLVCDPGQSKLIEFDASGQKIWERDVGQQPWACHGLPNGHRLVGSYNERSIVEFDSDGKEVWRVADLPGGPTGVERIENGNTLVACTEGGQVVEIDPSGKTVWRATLDGRPVDAHRLDDGRTLVALQNSQKVVEVDTSGKVVWEIGGVGMAFSVQRLPDGNTLVCSLNTPQVREYDPSGKVVWSQGSFTNPYTAQRLADGNTMVVDRDGVTEMDPRGATVRKIPIANPSRAWRY